MASPVEAQVILCDAAVADPSGKVHMLGAGWSRMPSPTTPHAVVLLIKVPWDRANQKLPLVLELRGPDGEPIELKSPTGVATVGLRTELEVGRPPGVVSGSMLDASFAINIPALPLPPGRYEWHIELAEQPFAVFFAVHSAS